MFITVPKVLTGIAILVLIAYTNHSAHAGDDYTVITRSPLLLDMWAEAELKFAEWLKTFEFNPAKITVEQIQIVSAYFRDFENCTAKLRGFTGVLEENINAITYNPLATFRMIRRILDQLQQLKDAFLNDDAEDITDQNLSDLFRLFPEDGWLREDDLKDAILSILRISHIYGLKANELANGVIIGLDTGIRLEAIHCYEIGVEATEKKYHVQSITWLEVAMDKKDDGTVDLSLLEQAYEKAIEEHDKTLSSEEPIEDVLTYENVIAPIKNQTDFKSLRKERRQVFIEERGGNTTTDPEGMNNYVNYWLLCSGTDLQTAETKSRLFCWYEGQSDPYLYIGPVKMELLSTRPDVVQMYDVIGEERIKRIQAEVSETLSISKVVGPNGDIRSTVRTAVTSWIHEGFIEELKVIPMNIAKLTGLTLASVFAAEMLQIAAYTFSGHYDVHVDAIDLPNYTGEKELGNRIATFMYYLHQPELGGQTVFPQARVAAQPIKGSAVFWYDIRSDGAVDYDTFHGACPVVFGRKWVANKWIRSLEQIWVRKCGLKPNEQYSIHLETRGDGKRK